MKNSIKFILTLAVLMTATIFSFAQRGNTKEHDPEKRAERQTAKMVEHLSLDDKQAAEVKAINEEHAMKMKEAHLANKGKDKEALKPVKADLEKSRTAALAKVLSPEQLQTYKTKKAEMKESRKGGQKMTIEERAERNTARMVEKLSLDQSQTEKVKAINIDYTQQMKDALEANKGKDRSAMKSIMDNLDKGKAMEMKSVLTAEQFEIYQEMKAKRMSKKTDRRRKARS
jgi:Spy/CpxP family protein refolding chaperone